MFVSGACYSEGAGIQEKDLVPVEMDSSSLDHSPIPSPMSNSGSSPQLSGIKRQAIDNSLFLPPSKLHDPQNHTAYTFYEVCQVFCMSIFNYKQHTTDRKHKLKLELKFDHKIHDKTREAVNPELSCDLCKIRCLNEDALKAHWKGQKHKRTLQKLELVKKNGEETVIQQPRCELCNIRC